VRLNEKCVKKQKIAKFAVLHLIYFEKKLDGFVSVSVYLLLLSIILLTMPVVEQSSKNVSTFTCPP